MTDIRADKVATIANDIPLTLLEGDEDADLLMLGWGSTWGSIASACKRARAAGYKVAHAHLSTSTRSPRISAMSCRDSNG